MKKQSANVVPQTAVDFLGTDQRQVIYQEIGMVPCLLALFSLGVCVGGLVLCYDKDYCCLSRYWLSSEEKAYCFTCWED